MSDTKSPLTLPLDRKLVRLVVQQVIERYGRTAHNLPDLLADAIVQKCSPQVTIQFYGAGGGEGSQQQPEPTEEQAKEVEEKFFHRTTNGRGWWPWY